MFKGYVQVRAALQDCGLKGLRLEELRVGGGHCKGLCLTRPCAVEGIFKGLRLKGLRAGEDEGVQGRKG